VVQSSVVAAFIDGTRTRAAASPRSSQPAAISASAIGGRSFSAAAETLLVDQQGLGRAADRHPPQLGVDDDVDGLLGIGGGVDEDVVQAFEVAQHRGAGLGLDAGDQALAAARDDQVDRAVQALEDHADGGAIGRLHRLHRAGGQAGGHQAALDRRVDREVRGDALRAAAQDHRVARAHAQRRGVGGHVRTALVDHGDHADRRTHPADVEAVGPGPARGGHAQRVGDLGDGLDPGGDAFQARFVQGQAVEHRARDAVGFGARQVLRVGGEDGGGGGADLGGHGADGGGALLWRGQAQGARALARRPAHVRHRRLQAHHARVIHVRSSPHAYAQVEAYLERVRRKCKRFRRQTRSRPETGACPGDRL